MPTTRGLFFRLYLFLSATVKPSPLYDEAGYIRHPKKSGTKEEVLARTFSHLEATLGDTYEIESKEDRMNRHAEDFIAAQHCRANEQSSFHPAFQIVGPHLPHKYTDDRSRERYGRFGHRTSDYGAIMFNQSFNTEVNPGDASANGKHKPISDEKIKGKSSFPGPEITGTSMLS